MVPRFPLPRFPLPRIQRPRCSQIIDDETFLIRKRFFNLFCNVKATNVIESADFSHFDPKIGCHSLEQLEKEDQISNRRSNAYHMVEIW